MKDFCLKTLFLSLSLSGLAGCAGPTSPFGALNFWDGDGEPLVLDYQNENESIQFRPSRQVLHMKRDLEVRIKAPTEISEKDKLKVVYDGRDVTKTFLKQVKTLSPNEMELHLSYENLGLRADRLHDIGIEYTSMESGTKIYRRFAPPECLEREMAEIRNTQPFNTPRQLVEELTTAGSKANLNPALLGGLIAQESGFNPSVVSPARAVGLTQITPLADKEIAELTPTWPRDPSIESLSISDLKDAISSGKVDGRKDWRLNPKNSVAGAALYLDYLRRYWSTEENQNLIQELADGKVVPVLLASYNSGAARVKKRMQDDGKNWLKNEDLKEAFKYVNKVSSYCYHFSEGYK